MNMEERYFRTTTKLLLQFDPVLQREQLIVLPMLYVFHEVHLIPTVEQFAPSGWICVAQRLLKLRLIFAAKEPKIAEKIPNVKIKQQARQTHTTQKDLNFSSSYHKKIIFRPALADEDLQ